MIKKIFHTAICILIMLSLCCCSFFSITCFAANSASSVCNASTPPEDDENDFSVIESTDVAPHYYDTQRITFLLQPFSVLCRIYGIYYVGAQFNSSGAMHNTLCANLNRISQQVILKLNE